MGRYVVEHLHEVLEVRIRRVLLMFDSQLDRLLEDLPIIMLAKFDRRCLHDVDSAGGRDEEQLQIALLRKAVCPLRHSFVDYRRVSL